MNTQKTEHGNSTMYTAKPDESTDANSNDDQDGNTHINLNRDQPYVQK